MASKLSFTSVANQATRKCSEHFAFCPHDGQSKRYVYYCIQVVTVHEMSGKGTKATPTENCKPGDDINVSKWLSLSRIHNMWTKFVVQQLREHK